MNFPLFRSKFRVVYWQGLRIVRFCTPRATAPATATTGNALPALEDNWNKEEAAAIRSDDLG